MVKVYVCPRCGGRVSGQMGPPPPCRECGAAPRVVEVDVGGKEGVPRYLNWAGAALLIISVIIFVLSALSILVLPILALLAPVVLSILLLIISLLLQRRIVSEAISLSQSELPGKKRVVRSSSPGRDRGYSAVKSGSLNAAPKARAVKIPIDR